MAPPVALPMLPGIMLTSRAPPRPKCLPTSIQKTTNPPVANAPVGQSTYQWTAVQKNRSEGPVNRRGGVFVTTLCVDFLTKALEGSTPKIVRIEKANFTPVQGAVWCYLIGGICVILKGVVAGKRSSGGSARENLIARLPEGLRPSRTLIFAAMARDVFEDAGRSVIGSSLATIVVTPEGDVLKHGGGTPEASIDLSAIRFCTDKGISLVDEVSVHAIDVAGSRLVTLQGVLLERNWQGVGVKKQLAHLPESCRPAKDLHFIVPGMSREGFHLVHVTPGGSAGCSGEITWKDSIWLKDKINLTGVMFEVSKDVMDLQLHKTENEMEVARQALMQDLYRRIVKKYSSIHHGLKKAFGITEESEMNFTQFVAGTKLLGYPGHMTKLWSMLDEDQGGSVDYDELLNAVVSGMMPKEEEKQQEETEALPAETDDPFKLPPLDSTRLPLSARSC